MNDANLAVVGGGAAGLTLAWLCSTAGIQTHVYERRVSPSPPAGAALAGQLTYFFPAYHRALAALYDYLGLYTEPRPLAYRYDGAPSFEETGRVFHKPHCFSFAPLANRRLKADMRRLTSRAKKNRQNRPTSMQLKQYFQGLHLSPMARIYQFPAILGALWQYPWQQIHSLPAPLCLDFLHLINAGQEARCLGDDLAAYIQRLLFKGDFTLHLDSSVTRVTRGENGLTLQTADGKQQRYDRVILTCNLAETRQIVSPLSREEHTLLRKMRYTDMPAFVHSDESAFQLGEERPGFQISAYQIKQDTHFAYHYDLHLLQDTPLYLSLNPAQPIASKSIVWQGRWRRLATDIATSQSMRALETIQGQGGLWHAGDYTNYQTSPFNAKMMAALELSASLGLRLPFKI